MGINYIDMKYIGLIDHSSLFSIQSESSLLHDNVAFVLCLDTLANGDELYMHVSRPPRPETPMYAFIQQLEEVTNNLEIMWEWSSSALMHCLI